MNTKGIKFLAALAVFAMAFAVFAYADVNTGIDATDEPLPDADDQGVVTLTKDMSFSSTLEIAAGVKTIDLNGHTLTVSVTSDTSYQAINYSAEASAGIGTFTIKNGKLVVSAEGLGDASSLNNKHGIYVHGAKVVLDGLTDGSKITADSAGKAKGIGVETTWGGIVVKNSKLEITASDRGLFDQETDPAAASNTGIVIDKASTVKVKAPAFGFKSNSYGITISDSSKVTINIAKVGDRAIQTNNFAVFAVGNLTIDEDSDLIIDDKIAVGNQTSPAGITLDGKNALGYTYGVTTGYTPDVNKKITAAKGKTAGEWSLSNGILTMDNYSGNNTFEGEFNKITVNGQGVIKVKDNVNKAIETAEALTIDTTSSGLLKISIAKPTAAAVAIKSNGLTVNGVDIDISVTSKTDGSAGIESTAAVAFNTVKSIDIDMGEISLATYGIKAEAVENNAVVLKNVSISNVGIVNDQANFNMTVSAGIGIKGAAVNFLASVVKISSSSYGILATTIGTSVSASYVDVDLAGNTDDITIVPYAVRTTDAVTIGFDSEFAFDSFYAGSTVGVTLGSSLTVSNGFVLVGDLTSTGAVTNNGDMLVLAKITVNDGMFENNGNIVISKYVLDNELAILTSDIALTRAGGATSGDYVSSFKLAGVPEFKADGTLFAHVLFKVSDSQNYLDAYGTLTYFTGLKTTEAASELFVSTFSGVYSHTEVGATETNTYTLYLDLSYTIADATDTTNTPAWTAKPSGSVYDGAAKTVAVDSEVKGTASANNKNETIVTAATVANVQLTISKGTFTSSTVVKSQVSQNVLLTGEGVFDGSIAGEGDIKITKGTFTGGISAKGAVLITEAVFSGDIVTDDGSETTTAGDVTFLKGTLNGNITADGKVVIGPGDATNKVLVVGNINAIEVDIKEKTKITGNISVSKNSVIFGELVGNLTMNGTYGSTAALSVTVTKMKGDLIFTGKYLETYVPTPSEADKSVYTITMGIDMNNAATVIKMVGATNATSTVASVPAYFMLESNIGDNVNEGTADEPKYHDTQFTLTLGELKVTRNVTVPKNSTLTIEDGQTLTILGKNYALTAAGAVKVSENATLNDSEADPATYGTIKSETSYNADSYDVYCNLGYAVANAVGKEIAVTDNVTLDSATIAKDTTVILKNGKKITLAPTGTTFTMGENAAIIIEKGSIDLATGKIYTGDFRFGDDRLVLTGVELAAAGSIESAEATTGTPALPAMLKVSLNYKDGNANLVSGNMKGAITLDNQSADAAKSLPIRSGSLTITAGTFYPTALVDKAAEIEEGVVKKKITSVENDGNINCVLMGSMLTINGSYSGEGGIIMPTSGVTVKTTADVDMTIVDKDMNGVRLEAVKMVKPASDTTSTYDGGDFTLVPTAATEAANSFVTLTGAGTAKDIAYSGDIYTVGYVKAKNFTIYSDVNMVVSVISELSIVGEAGQLSVTAEGLLTAIGDINYYIKDDAEYSGYGKLAYEVTYMDGEGVVFTSLATALDTGVATDLYIEDLAVEDKALVVPEGVTITIAEGKQLTLKGTAYLVLGEASTVLGALPGKVVGKVVLEGTSFVVFYADAVSEALETEIYQANGTDPAKASEFTINDYQYALVYGSGATTRGQTDAVLIPELTGYRFNGWDGATTDVIGLKNFNGTATPYSYRVVFASVDGIVYMVGGRTIAQTGVPVEASYGEFITAVAAIGYQGKALVNGENYLMVEGDMIVTGSGVAPIPEPQPQPEPVIEDTGITLTDILLIVLVILIAVMCVVIILRFNRS